MRIGQAVQLLRLRLHYSVRTAANLVGYSPQGLRNIESGNTQPSMAFLDKFARCVGGFHPAVLCYAARRAEGGDRPFDEYLALVQCGTPGGQVSSGAGRETRVTAGNT